ncbi:helix-turn-helix domain-containing protein [Flavobacterium sp. YO12]|uniref:helix-turn-helix domain-containing protein n=1 Tax=Flavobacterium sp. YO12 TaxID=1920029 RepID=UPI00352AC604
MSKKEKKESTYAKTLELFLSGLSVEEIAERRSVSKTTIVSHLAKLYVDGQDFDLSQFVSGDEIAAIEKAQIELEKPSTLKPYFDYFEEKMSYDKIRFGLAFIERKHNKSIL